MNSKITSLSMFKCVRGLQKLSRLSKEEAAKRQRLKDVVRGVRLVCAEILSDTDEDPRAVARKLINEVKAEQLPAWVCTDDDEFDWSVW